MFLRPGPRAGKEKDVALDITNLNRRIDHAALKPETTAKEIKRLCFEARQFGFYAVAVNPVWVPLAREELSNSGVKTVSVSGFPLGASRTDIKVTEAVRATSDGAHEIDMVANIGWLVEGEFTRVEDEISTVRKNLPYNVVLKVIIESGLLTLARQLGGVAAVVNGGAQFVKTSTGFFGGVTTQQVTTLARAARGQVEIKASGGIRTLDQCRQLLEAGASRLGSSASVEIMKDLRSRHRE
jgi:deoxyribose-phosphate aldolase